MSSKTKIDHALKLIENDPQLAADFDEARASDYPGKSRREAAELGLQALEAKRGATLAGERAKAMQSLAKTAKEKFKSFITMGRPEKPKASCAADLLSLSDADARAMLDKAAFANSGQAVRHQIKRALLTASHLEKGRLYARYESAITAFPNETIS